jgi:hypothetical protein
VAVIVRSIVPGVAVRSSETLRVAVTAPFGAGVTTGGMIDAVTLGMEVATASVTAELKPSID